MTVATTTSKSGPYAGAGTTGPFTVGFRFLDNEHLQVIKTSTMGMDTTLLLDTDYTVTGAGAESGTVTLAVALAVGESLTILRNVPTTQETDYVQNDAFPAQSHEDALDKLTMITQQLKEQADRSLTLPATVEGASTMLPVPASNQIIGWNVDGDELQNYPLSELASAIAFATYRYDTFDGDGVETNFTLTSDPVTLGNMDVSINGVTQVPGTDYTLLDGALVFVTPPAGGTVVLARYGQAVVSGPSADALNVTATDGAGGTLWQNVQEFINRIKGGSGAASVGYTPSGTGAVATTVEDILDAQLTVDYVALRAYTGLAKTVRITGLLTTAQPQGIAGFFQYDETDVVSSDNGGTIIVGSDGRRWKRVFDGPVNVLWFGADRTGVADSTTAIQAALNVVNDCYFPFGNYIASSTLSITGNNKKVFSDAGTSRADRTTGARCRIFTSGANGVQINGTGITIEGIYIESSTTRVQGDGSYGVRAGILGDLTSKCADFKFVNSVSYGFDIGIGLHGLGYGIKIDNSYVLQFKTRGFHITDDVTVVSMDHPVIETNAAVGTLGILHHASQLTLNSPTIQNCRRGIQVRSGWVEANNPWFEGCREFDVLVSSGDKPHVVLNDGRYAHPNTGTATTACVSVLDVDAIVIVNDPIMYVYNGNTIGAFGQFAAGGKAVINRLDILDAFTSGATAGNGVYTTNAPAFFSLARNRNIDGYIFGTSHKLHLKEYATTTTTVKAVDAAGGLGAELLTANSFLVREGVTYRWNGAAWV